MNLTNLSTAEQHKLNELVLPKWSKYIPHSPHPKQQAFCWLDSRDVFYGGAAGGGKSDALLMAALQYVDIPGYNAVLFRDTYANLTKAEGLLDRAHEWLQNTDAKWKGDQKYYVFPSGARIWFSYLDGPLDHFNHQGAAYQFVGIDEIVNVRENQAVYVGFSRCRKKTALAYKKDLKRLTNYTKEEIDHYYKLYEQIPLRFRSASNPPTAEQLAKGAWVKSRYVDKDTRGDRIFIPAGIDDNPSLGKTEYVKSLMHLDPVTRAQLLKGDWLIRVKGRMFDRSWFHIVDQAPADARRVRFWDPAHTEPTTKKNKAGTTDPDWFSGTKASITEQKLVYIENVRRWRKTPLASKQAVKQQAELDGRSVAITIEREPAAGINLIDDYIRLLAGFVVKGYTSPKGYKNDQAMALASYAEAGNVYIVNGPWVEDFLDEIEVYPDGLHDDQLRSCVGAFNELVGSGETNIRWL
jgi:predicted phage terminase large subunit-like protein